MTFSGWNPVHGFDNNPPPGYPRPGPFDPPDVRFSSAGWNPIHGTDAGRPPPGFPPVQGATQPPNYTPVSWAMPASSSNAGTTMPTYNSGYPYPWPYQYGVYPAANATEACNDAPGINLNNAYGGTGSLPGYSYLFPQEHTLIHVIKSKTPPWQLTNNAPYDFHKAQVPCNTSIKDLLAGFGATNANPKLNVVHEVIQDGKGGWRRGIRANGEEKKSVGQMGWNETRTGQVKYKGRDVVWVWITKD